MKDEDLSRMKSDVQSDHRWAMAQRLGLFFLLAAVIAGIGVLGIRDHYRGKALEELGTALNAQRDQLSYCQDNPKERKNEVCTEPVSPPADEVLESVQGPIGPVGPIGPSGPQGIQGIQGIEGRPGPQGIEGEKGEDGKPGLNGKNGDPGPPGPSGPPGPEGSPGPQGEPGPKGDTGDSGQRGQDAVPFTFLFTIPASTPTEQDKTYRCVIEAPSIAFTCTQVENN